MPVSSAGVGGAKPTNYDHLIKLLIIGDSGRASRREALLTRP